MIKWGNIYFVFVFLLILSGGQAIAEKQTGSANDSNIVTEITSDQVGKETSELLIRINTTYGKLQRYMDKLEAASKEDHLVFSLQIESLQGHLMGDLYQLTDLLLEQEKKNKQPELRAQVETLLADIMPRLWLQIKNLRGDIDALRAQRSEASSDERLSLENEVSKFTTHLDVIFEMSLSHIEHMDKIGLEIKKPKITLSDLLMERADELSGRILLAIERISVLKVRIEQIPDDAEVAKLLIASGKSLDTNTASMDRTLGLMETLELATNDHRALLVETTQDVSSGLLDTGVALSLVRRAVKRISTWLSESGLQLFLKLLLFLGILIVFRLAKRLAAKALDKILRTSNLSLSRLARRMIISIVSNLIMILGIMIALSQLGITLGPLLAGLGVAGFIIGFALQDTLSNFASGIMILLYRPYDVGDQVDVAGVFGKVKKMNLVSTNITTLDNQMIVIPNNKIWGDVIKNITAQNVRRVDMVFGIAYSDDVSKAEVVLNDILKKSDLILETPEPMVRLHTLGASSVDFIVRPWTKVDDYWDVYWEVTRAVKIRFDVENISIPFPQSDVHMYHENITEAESVSGDKQVRHDAVDPG